MTTPNPATDAVVPADAEFVQNWRYMTSSNDNSNAYITRRGLARLIARIDAELAENAKLRDALSWYADDHHYQAVHAIDQTVLIMSDYGERARDALEPKVTK